MYHKNFHQHVCIFYADAVSGASTERNIGIGVNFLKVLLQEVIRIELVSLGSPHLFVSMQSQDTNDKVCVGGNCELSCGDRWEMMVRLENSTRYSRDGRDLLNWNGALATRAIAGTVGKSLMVSLITLSVYFKSPNSSYLTLVGSVTTALISSYTFSWISGCIAIIRTQYDVISAVLSKPYIKTNLFRRIFCQCHIN